MGRRINHQSANSQRRILENGHESVTDGSVSDGIGRGTSRVFDVAGTSSGSQKVTVRRLAPGSGRRIDPRSEEGRRIAAAALAGQPALPTHKAPPPAAPALSQGHSRPQLAAERKPSRLEIIEASRQLQGFRPKRKKKRAKDKDLVGTIVGFNYRSESPVSSQSGTASQSVENTAKPSVNVKKREKLRKLIASMFGPLLSLRRR